MGARPDPTAGATIYLPPEDIRVAPEALRDWLVAQGITISFLPTPLAEVAITLAWPSQTTLRLLLTGGDMLRQYPPSTVPFALINNYGPTESTVVATSGQVLPSAHAGVPPIGRPIANTEVYILDQHLHPVPIGVAGELYIGGAGLARGYLNAPELSASKFIPHPYSKQPGARLYRTGDRARFRADGQIAFLGRSDDQIKIRGVRIEPDEIAAS